MDGVYPSSWWDEQTEPSHWNAGLSLWLLQTLFSWQSVTIWKSDERKETFFISTLSLIGSQDHVHSTSCQSVDTLTEDPGGDRQLRDGWVERYTALASTIASDWNSSQSDVGPFLALLVYSHKVKCIEYLTSVCWGILLFLNSFYFLFSAASRTPLWENFSIQTHSSHLNQFLLFVLASDDKKWYRYLCLYLNYLHLSSYRFILKEGGQPWIKLRLCFRCKFPLGLRIPLRH